MEIIKPNTNYDFVGKMKTMGIISTALILLTLVLWFVKKPNYGIDFMGGTEITAAFNKPVSIEEVRKALDSVKLGDAEVKPLGIEGGSGYIIRVKRDVAHSEGGEISDVIVGALKDKIGELDETKLGASVVGPRAGAELRSKAFTATFISLALMLVYIAIRFDFVSGLGAAVALFHDVAITILYLLITNAQFSLTIIAALLTIVGYSVNDTIVIYDRVRENQKKYRNKTLAELLNGSLNDTLSRTLLTSGITLISVLALVVLTSGDLRDFSIAMTVGMVSGVYSTVYIASAIMLLWDSKVRPVLEKDAKKK